MSASAAAKSRGRNPDVPEPGYFLRSLVRGGWKVPCRIIRHSDGAWQAEVDGQLRDPVNIDPHVVGEVMNLWHYAEECTEAEYIFRSTYREWARQNEPDHPCLHPRVVINLGIRAPLF